MFKKIKLNTQRILKRVDRALTGPIVQYSEQFLYGHREILFSYGRLPPNGIIKGELCHGWSIEAGLGIRKFPKGRYIHLTWCQERIMRSGIKAETTIAIGAPFIYALDQVNSSISKFELNLENRKRKFLFFPVHGNEFSQQNAESQISLFNKQFNPEESAVCLYWVEYVNPKIYGAYKAAGFEILCAGFSGQMEHTGLGYSARKLAGSPIGGRPGFLLNTIAFLANFETVIMGGLGTVTFYAAYMNKEIVMLHDYFKTSYLDMDYEKGNSFENNQGEVDHRNLVSEFMRVPFEKVDFNSSKFRLLAQQELGKKDMRTPNDLVKLITPHLAYGANEQSISVYGNQVLNFFDTLEEVKSRLL